jgi:hypothetical protein
MLKAADALAEEGYEVVLVSTRSTPWAAEADLDVQKRRPGLWRSIILDYSRSRGPLLYVKSGVRRRVARALAGRTRNVPFRLATRAFARVGDELVSAALATSADFFYGGTTGGIAAAFEAARRAGRPYALDLEDFFTGEPMEGSLDQKLAERIEREILPGAKFLTASSSPIADAYEAKYGVAAETFTTSSLSRTVLRIWSSTARAAATLLVQPDRRSGRGLRKPSRPPAYRGSRRAAPEGRNRGRLPRDAAEARDGEGSAPCAHDASTGTAG